MKRILKLVNKEDGEVNTIAIILLALVVIAVVAIFRERLIDLVNQLFDKISESTELN